MDDAATVWVSDCAADAVLRFDPRTEAFERFGYPRAAPNVRHSLVRHGQVWLPESGCEHLCVIGTV